MDQMSSTNSNSAADWIELEDPATKKKYYYNNITGQTSWTAPSVPEAPTKMPWREHIDPNSGKKYFHNEATGQTQWDMPDEYRAYMKKKIIESGGLASVDLGAVMPVSAYVPPPPPQPQPQPQPQPSSAVTPQSPGSTVGNEQSAWATFRQMLSDHRIDETCDWTRALKIIAQDDRFKVLRTNQERKSAFEQYQDEKRDEKRREERERQRRIESDFVAMLDEAVAANANGPNKVTFDTPYRQIAMQYGSDPRYLAVERHQDRLELYDRFLYDLDRREKHLQEERRKKALEDFQHLLVRRTEMGLIKYDSDWRTIRETIRDDASAQQLDEVDKLQIWDRFIRNLIKIEHDRVNLEREQTKMRRIRDRAMFWKVLERLHQEGKLSLRCRWRDVKELVRDEEAYRTLQEQESVVRPHDLFDEFVRDLENKYHDQKKIIKSLLKSTDFSVEENTTLEQLVDVLQQSNATRFAELGMDYIRAYLEDHLERIRERKKEEEHKIKKRRAEKLKDMLRERADISSETTYDQAKQLLADVTEWKKLEEDDELRQKTFDEHIRRLRRREKRKREEEDDEDYSGAEDEDRSHRDRESRQSSKRSRFDEHVAPSQQSGLLPLQHYPQPMDGSGILSMPQMLPLLPGLAIPMPAQDEQEDEDMDDFQRRIQQLHRRKQQLLAMKKHQQIH